MPQTLIRLTLALFLVLALIAASCGGDDDDAGGNGDDTVEAGNADAESDDAVEAGDNGDGDDAGEGDDATGSSGSSVASVAACDVLTLEDLTSRGVEVLDGPIQQDSGTADFDTCTFGYEGGPFGVNVTVTVLDPETSFAIGDAEEIPGIGSRAVYSPAGRFIIVVLEDRTQITITVPFFLGPEDPRDLLIELGTIAAG